MFLRKLNPYLKPPIFPDDEDKTFTASLLHFILWSVLLGVVLFTLIAPIPPQRRLIAWLYVLVIAILTLALMVFMRRGYVRRAAISINLGLWIILTVAAYFNGGVLAPAYSGYLIVVSCTSLLVSWRWGLAAAVASTLAGVVFLLAEANHWLPDWLPTYSLGAVWGANVAYFFIVTMLLALTLRAIKRALQQTRCEIVERGKTEQALRRSEQRFRAIFDSVNDAIVVQDLADGRIVDVNQKMCEMYSYTAEEARRLTVQDLSAGIPPYTQQDAVGWFQKAAWGEPQIFEWLAKDHSGRQFWVEINMRRAAIDDEDRLLVVVRDIDDRKRAEEALRRSEAYYQAIVNATPVMLWLKDTHNRLLRLNPAAAAFEGVDAALVEGQPAADLYPPEQAEAAYRDDLEVIQAGQPKLGIVEQHTSVGSGQLRWLETGRVPVRDEQGQIIGVLACAIEITERKQAEERAQHIAHGLRAVLESADELIGCADLDTLYRRAVELGREKIGLERCGLFLLDEEGLLHGTYGTDRQGATTDERVSRFAPADRTGLDDLDRRFWHVQDVPQTYWEGDRQTIVHEHGWVCATLIRQQERRLGVFYNDTAITGVPINEEQQEVLAVYCSLLGSLIELKQAEATLQQREAYLRAMLDNYPYWIWLKDTEGRYLAANRAMAQAYDQPNAEALIGRTDWDFTPEKAAQSLADERVVMEQRAQKVIEEIIIEHGQEKWSETFKSPIFDAQGKVIGTIGFTHDITARKRMEEAIRESEALFRYLADNAPAMMSLTDQAGVTTYLNQAWREFRGPVPLLPLHEWAQRVHPSDRERYLFVLEAGVRDRRKYNLEYRLRRADGQYRWLLDTAVPRYASDEQFAGFIGITIDITDRRNAEEALAYSEGRLRLVTENMGDAVCQLDAQLRFVYLSPSVERMFGYPARVLLAQALLNNVHPDDGAHLDDQLRMAIELRVPTMRQEYRYRHTTGDYLWVESEIRFLYNGAGDFTGAIISARDVSMRKQAEFERENLIKELEGKNTELERFTYTVSHDLKSPLITIRGFLGYLEKDAVAGNLGRLRADIQRIAEATGRMQRLLDDLLELSRIGRLLNPPQEIPFENIVREAVEMVRGQTEARGIQVEIAPNLPVVHGDHVRLVEVVQNLVDNAAKFMGQQPAPQITIGALGHERAGLPIFYVQDNGQGIDPQYHERIFGLFNKLDAQTAGTGIGLTLVKRIIDLHGGQIWVESEGAGQGTTFYFTLPGAPEGK